MNRREIILGTIGALFAGLFGPRRTGLHSMRYGLTDLSHLSDHRLKEVHLWAIHSCLREAKHRPISFKATKSFPLLELARKELKRRNYDRIPG